MFNFETFPTLQTERLRLRQILPSDADAVFSIRSDYQVTQYNIGPAYTDIAQANDLIQHMTTSYQQQRSLRWGITRLPDNTIIGMVGYNYWNQTDHRGSVGFDLRRDLWHKGIMSEALQRIIHFGFQQMRLNRIEADASIYNVASINLLKKLGFVQEGIQREQYYEEETYHDLVLLALLKREWQK